MVDDWTWIGPVNRRIFSMVNNWTFDRQGNPISGDRWGELHSDMDYKRVAETDIGDWWISTVWIGINHNYGPGPPIIFETMAFYQGTAPLETLHPELRDWDTAMDRYATEAEAVAGHDNFCTEMRRVMAAIEMADEVMRDAVDAVNNNPDRENDA